VVRWWKMKKLNKIKDIVREVLSEDKKTRNSDTLLILQTLRKMGFKIYIDYNDLERMPSFESITRSRRYWQNNNKKFLSKENVAISRDMQQEKYKEVFT